MIHSTYVRKKKEPSTQRSESSHVYSFFFSFLSFLPHRTKKTPSFLSPIFLTRFSLYSVHTAQKKKKKKKKETLSPNINEGKTRSEKWMERVLLSSFLLFFSFSANTFFFSLSLSLSLWKQKPQAVYLALLQFRSMEKKQFSNCEFGGDLESKQYCVTMVFCSLIYFHFKSNERSFAKALLFC